MTELKGEINMSTIRVGDFNTPLSVIDRTNRQKICKDTEDLNNRINQLDVIDIYGTLHPTTAEYTLSLSAHGTKVCNQFHWAKFTGRNSARLVPFGGSKGKSISFPLPANGASLPASWSFPPSSKMSSVASYFHCLIS